MEKKEAPMKSLDIISIFTMLFSDDIVLVADSQRNLRKLLDILDDYLNRKKLELNMDKTEALVFRKCDRLEEDVKLSFNGRISRGKKVEDRKR